MQQLFNQSQFIIIAITSLPLHHIIIYMVLVNRETFTRVELEVKTSSLENINLGQPLYRTVWYCLDEQLISWAQWTVPAFH